MRIAPASGSQPLKPTLTGRSASGGPSARANLPQPSTRSFTAVLDERAGGATPRPAEAVSAPATSRPARARRAVDAARPVRAMLERAIGSEKQIDALLDAAARGKTFKPGELLAMQALVSRYSQTVEVVSRVADRLVGAVKQTMGTQG